MNFFATGNSFFDNLIYRFTQWNVIVGLILAVGGLMLSIFARKVVGKIKNTNKVENSDKLFTVLKFTSLGLVLIGLIFTLIK